MAENSAKRRTLDRASSVPNIPQSTLGAVRREKQYLPSPANIADEKDDYSLGERVIVNTAHQVDNKLGYIRSIGKIHVRPGRWYGVELDEPFGK